ncbi:MAG TPA: hypothetical protein VK457_20935 [Chloroflexota bacterium]|nr:hypothetical protein [Chloroflexota bacterium]
MRAACWYLVGTGLLILAGCGSKRSASLTSSGAIQGTFKPEKGDCANLPGDTGEEDDLHVFLDGQKVQAFTKAADRFEGTGATFGADGSATLEADLESSSGKHSHLSGTIDYGGGR